MYLTAKTTSQVDLYYSNHCHCTAQQFLVAFNYTSITMESCVCICMADEGKTRGQIVKHWNYLTDVSHMEKPTPCGFCFCSIPICLLEHAVVFHLGFSLIVPRFDKQWSKLRSPTFCQNVCWHSFTNIPHDTVKLSTTFLFMMCFKK